jgi:hypothetical protein
MAAVDLSASTKAPDLYVQAGVGTTWQEFKLPPWATGLSIRASGAVWYTFLNSQETPTDGGAVGTHVWPLDADAEVKIVIRDAADRPIHAGLVLARSVFVAAQAGTATVRVMVEKGRG